MHPESSDELTNRDNVCTNYVNVLFNFEVVFVMHKLWNGMVWCGTITGSMLL